jgi:hypothetical protein
MASTPEPPGPPVAIFTSAEGGERAGELITWIEEDTTELLRSRGVLDYRKACVTGGGVMIVHRNLEVGAFKVGIRRVNPKALAISPRNLDGVQRIGRMTIRMEYVPSYPPGVRVTVQRPHVWRASPE